LKGRAIAGPYDYDQIPALVERSRLRVKNFYADLDARLSALPFIAGDRFSAADITGLATVEGTISRLDTEFCDLIQGAPRPPGMSHSGPLRRLIRRSDMSGVWGTSRHCADIVNVSSLTYLDVVPQLSSD
jgi:hypothetical protein